MLGMGEVCSTMCMTVCVCVCVWVGVRALGLFHLNEVLVFQLTLDLGRRSKLNCHDIFQILWTISHFKYPFSSPWSLIHRAVDCDPIIIGFPMCSFKYTHTHTHTHTHTITNKPGLVTLHCLGTERVNL